MMRWINFLISGVAYAIGMSGLVLFILFVGGWDVLPWHIDDEPTKSIGLALVINMSLVALFGIQHSVMARPGFKRIITRVIPKSLERSCYCVATAVVIGLLCYFWQPLPGTVWHFESHVARIALTTLQVLGWCLVVSASFMINHFELFGLKQTFDRLINRPEPKPEFVAKYMYRFVRHPLQLGVLIGIWSTPDMSVSHLFLSAAMTTYITIGLYFEERDLVATLGEDYLAYRRSTPMILPKFTGTPQFSRQEDAESLSNSAATLP